MEQPFSFLSKPRVWGELSGTNPIVAFNSEEDSYNYLLNGNFTLTVQRFVKSKVVNIFITCDGTTRTIAFAQTMSWIGGAPTSITANKHLQISLVCTGTTAASVFATYGVET